MCSVLYCLFFISTKQQHASTVSAYHVVFSTTSLISWIHIDWCVHAYKYFICIQWYQLNIISHYSTFIKSYTQRIKITNIVNESTLQTKWTNIFIESTLPKYSLNQNCQHIHWINITNIFTESTVPTYSLNQH